MCGKYTYSDSHVVIGAWILRRELEQSSTHQHLHDIVVVIEGGCQWRGLTGTECLFAASDRAYVPLTAFRLYGREKTGTYTDFTL